MAVTAMTGVVGFGPQPVKGTEASQYFRHKATQVDLGVIDDTRLGVPEIGGRPVPTFPYKAGVVVAGGITIQPRLENTLGWLLRGLLGGYSVVETVGSTEDPDGVLAAQSLDGSTIADVGLTDPPEARFISLTVTLVSDVPVTPTKLIQITGDTTQYDYELAGLPAGTHYFYSPVEIADVTEVIVPTIASGTLDVGWTLDNDSDADTYATHTFKFNPDDPSAIPWLSFRKHIPRKENAPASDLGEIFKDCKIVSATLGLPNDAPITMRVDAVGRQFTLDHAPDAWTWANTFEDFQSIPIGAETGGALEIPDGTELPIVAATVGFANAPLDFRQEKVFGDPYLEDVTIIQRALTFDIVVKWNNPDLYAQVLTGTTSGTAWTSTPFTSSLDIHTFAPTAIPGVTGTPKYELAINAPSVMMGLNGPIALAGNQAVLMRFTGTALDNSGEYVTFVLKNKQPHYGWPRL